MQRAKEAKEKAEKEKQERLAKKKQLIDISSGELYFYIASYSMFFSNIQISLSLFKF